MLEKHGIYLIRVPNSGGLAEKGDLKQDPHRKSEIDLTKRWTIEVKRQETYKLGEWIAQADDQAQKERKKPLLLFRKSRQPWRCVISLEDYLQLLKDAEVGKQKKAGRPRSSKTATDSTVLRVPDEDGNQAGQSE